MTRQEYINALLNVYEQLKNEGIQAQSEIRSKIDELYYYKPVSSLWYVIDAYYIMLEADYGRSWERVASKLRASLSGKEPYTGIAEFIEYHRTWVNRLGDKEEVKHLDYIYGSDLERSLAEKAVDEVVENYYQKRSDEALFLLMKAYYNIHEIYVFLIIRMKLIKSGYILNDNRNVLWYYKEKNYDYFEEKILHSNVAFLLIEESDNSRECNLLALLLHDLGHSVYILTNPIEVEGDVHSQEILDLCLENAQGYEESVAIPVCEVLFSDGHKEDNRAELIQYLYQNEFEDNFGLLLASGSMIYSLLGNPVIQKHMECLSEFDPIGFLDKMYFGWIGNYLAYISDVYDFNVEKRLCEDIQCDFSIVIPARNSAGTLYYTLQTCLNQDYKGTYEIIVSDNSTEGHDEVYQVCRDLNDQRIRYIKTPRNLALTKSFEFAFLQARGDFIFSVGSDDGVCPWALSMLKHIMQQYPNEEVIQWVRGSYIWKDFVGDSVNKLLIPGRFNKKEPYVHYVEHVDYFARVLKNPEWVFSMPNLYLNSGFRKSYIHKLLEKTGRLWDGCNQDVYMGVINAAINKKILNVDYPLIIAGMSSNSMGYTLSKPDSYQTTYELERDIRKSTCMGDNIGVYVMNGIVKTEILEGAGSIFSIYQNFFRGIQLGVLPKEWLAEVINDKVMFLRIISEYSIMDDNFDRRMHYARYLAKQKGEEFLQWFDDTIYKKVMQPKYCPPSQETKVEKGYKEGPTEGGGLAIDASNYGVTNIAEAMELFGQFIDWTPESWQQELKKRKEKRE